MEKNSQGFTSNLHLSEKSNTREVRRQEPQPVNDWEKLKQELDEETKVYTAPQLSGDHMGTASKVLTKMTGFLVYVALAGFAASCVWMGLQELSVFRKGCLVVVLAYALSGMIMTIDAVILNRGYKRDKSLYVFAWFLNFIYPFRRDNHLIKRSNVLSYLLAIAVVASFAFVGYRGYDFQRLYKAVYLAKAEEREKVTELMCQDADGVALGEQLYKTFHVNAVSVNDSGKTRKIVLLGESCYNTQEELLGQERVSWNTKDNPFLKIQKYNVPTQLVFIKSEYNSDYRLSTAKVNDAFLLPCDTYNYWRKVVLQWNENGQRVE